MADGRWCREAQGGLPVVSAAEGCSANGMVGKECSAGVQEKVVAVGGGAGEERHTARFMEYAEKHMGIAADEIKPTAVRRISELDALLHALEDAGVVRLCTAPLDGGQGGSTADGGQDADGGCSALVGESGDERHSTSNPTEKSIFGFARLYVDDAKRFHEGESLGEISTMWVSQICT